MKPTSFDRELNYLSIDIGDDVIMTHHNSFQKNFTVFSKQIAMEEPEDEV